MAAGFCPATIWQLITFDHAKHHLCLKPGKCSKKEGSHAQMQCTILITTSNNNYISKNLSSTLKIDCKGMAGQKFAKENMANI